MSDSFKSAVQDRQIMPNQMELESGVHPAWPFYNSLQLGDPLADLIERVGTPEEKTAFEARLDARSASKLLGTWSKERETEDGKWRSRLLEKLEARQEEQQRIKRHEVPPPLVQAPHLGEFPPVQALPLDWVRQALVQEIAPPQLPAKVRNTRSLKR